MWSATWDKEVNHLAQDFLTNPVQINVGSLDLHANPNIKQIIDVCDRRDKYNRFVISLQSLH